jgi:ATP-dependent exoDNAse (exonuclease V) beta subunit
MQNNNLDNFNKFTIQKSFAISAGAGSGKTYTLSRRYTNAVLGFDFFIEDESQDNFIEKKDDNRVELSQIVTMTYTEAAALEMKERIFDLMQKVIEFDNLSLDDGDYDSIKMGMDKLDESDKQYVKDTLQNALDNSNSAFISTIHSFCLDTISVNSDIAKIDAKLDIIQDDEKQKILDEIRFKVFSSDENETLKTFSSYDKFRALQIIEKYTANNQFRLSFDKFVENSIDIDTYKDMIKELYPLPDINNEVYDEIENSSDKDIRKKWFQEYVENFENFEAKPWNSFTIETITKSGKNKGQVKQSALGLGMNKFPFLTDIKEQYEEYLKVYSIIEDYKEQEFINQLKLIHNLLNTIYDKYQARLKQEQKIDFDSIITLTDKIVGQISNKYEYIMVDEFQDTNSTQNSIVNKISKDKNLFIVGDAKQSIYSFQGAELEVFNGAVSSITTVPMNINYRSDKKILSFVNDIFKELFEDDIKQDNLISSNFKARFTTDDKLISNSKDDGTVEFLISQDIDHHSSDGVQYNEIAKFIKAIKDDTIEGYDEVKEKIKQKEKAIAILFDSKGHMLKLKRELNNLGIECKVSATEEFYATKEINDIFLVLKATLLLKLPLEKLIPKHRYFIAGALRSNILRYNEAEILTLLENIEEIKKIFTPYIEQFDNLKISDFIKFIVDSSNLFETYLYLGDISQRAANIEKLLEQIIVYESGNDVNIWNYIKELERLIYFAKDLKEDEAFYKSDNVESIELCTIHSTKGLAYPMVILAQSEKSLHANSSGDMGLSFSTFTLNQNNNNNIDTYSAVGFKIGAYEPLIYRILKQISRNKHEAEKKRLLYVALTRAEHNLIIAGSVYEIKVKATKKNPEPDPIINYSKFSYLNMIADQTFGATAQELLDGSAENLSFVNKEIFKNIVGEKLDPLKYDVVALDNRIVKFKNSTKEIASDNKEHIVNENISAQAIIGTAIHSILERYWQKLDDENILKTIYFKYSIFDEVSKEKIKKYIDNFKSSSVYEKLKSGVEYQFELKINLFEDDKQIEGIIDLVYFDLGLDGWIIVDFKSNSLKGVKDLDKFTKENGYDKQLENYERLCGSKGMKVVGKMLLWLDKNV